MHKGNIFFTYCSIPLLQT